MKLISIQEINERLGHWKAPGGGVRVRSFLVQVPKVYPQEVKLK